MYPLGSRPHQNIGMKFWFHVGSQNLILSEDLKIWYSSHAAHCYPQSEGSALG